MTERTDAHSITGQLGIFDELYVENGLLRYLSCEQNFRGLGVSQSPSKVRTISGLCFYVSQHDRKTAVTEHDPLILSPGKKD